MTKYFKKIYADRVACGVWNEGDGVNYLPGSNYTVEDITEAEYISIASDVKNYFSEIELKEELITLKQRERAIVELIAEGKLIEKEY